MKIEQFCEYMERIAPQSYAYDWDNVGLLIGTDKPDIRKVLVALDLTTAVADEAVKEGFDLVLTHHPIFLDPVRRMNPSGFDTAAAYRLIRNGIAMYAAHTNLDAAPGGVNDTLARVLGLKDVVPIPADPLGRMGRLDAPISFRAFVMHCETCLQASARIVGDLSDTIQTVAVIGGAGGSDAALIKQSGCDVFVTGEMKHHQALEAAYLGLHCCVLGHYETENIVLKPLIDRLQKENSDVLYKITHSGTAPLLCLQGGNRYE